MNREIEIRRFENEDQVVQGASEAWLEVVCKGGSRPFSVALLGGRIAAPLFKAFADLVRERGLTLERVHYFWSDERCVPPEDPESNFGLARDNLFAILETPESRIHRIRGELPPSEAAAVAEKELRSIVVETNADGQPVVDLVFLGLGEDGHTASLFPEEGDKFASDPAVFRHVHSTSKPPPERVTMGYPVLAAAANLFVVSAGRKKEEALQNSLDPGGRTPLGRVLALRKNATVFTDCRPC